MKINLRLQSILCTLIGAIILLSAALYNGFPILFSDSATYIESGLEFYAPSDRPMTYGIFILLSSLDGFSIWLVVFFQSLILSYLVILLFKSFTKVEHYRLYCLTALFFVSSFSVLPYVSGQIMPDIFTSIGILSLGHIFFNKDLKKLELWGIYFIFFLSMAMHMSHIAIFGLMLIIIFGFRKKLIPNYNKSVFRSKILVMTFLSMAAFIPSSAPQAKSKHVFFLGRMAENGILTSYLKENCPKKHYKLCDCIDSIPDNANDFVWDRNSPVYKQYEKWKYAKQEYNEIILQTFIRPKYLIRHITESIKSTLRQLLFFKAGDGNGPLAEGTRLYQIVLKYFPHEINESIRSNQNTGILVTSFSNLIFKIVICISMILLLMLFLFNRNFDKLDKSVKSLLLFLSSGILINSFVNASLAMVTDRYGAKVIWFIPLMVFILIGNLYPHFRSDSK